MKFITGALNFETLVRPLGDLPQAIAAAVHGTDVGNVTMVWQNDANGYLATMSGADVYNSITVQLVPVSSSAWINPATYGITSGFVPGDWVLMITDTDDSNAWGGDPVLIERGYNISGTGALVTTVSGLTGVVAMDMSNPSSPTAVSGRGGLINTTLLLPDATLYPAGGILDLNDNDLIVRSGNLTNIAGWLTNGYDSGKWDDESNLAGAEQPAIDSTTAMNDPTYLESLGYAKIGTGAGNLNLTTFDGYNVSSGDVVVKFTYYGDANLDGAVDATDLGIATNGYGLTGWSNGDFNYSGSVDGGDLTLLDNAFAAAPGSFSATTISSSEIDLAWTNTTPTGTDVSILMSTDGTSYYPYDSVASNQSSYAVTGLDSGTTYHFMAQAYKSSVPSSISSAAYATTTGIPSPEDVTATADSPHQVTVGWDDPAALATTFDVQRSGDGGTTWSTIASGLSANSGSNTYVDTSAYDGTDYLYQVIGHDASSNVSNASATAEAVTPLVTPTSLSATTAVDANLVDATLNWSENSTVSSGVQYEIDRSTDQANWTVLTVTDSGDTSNTYVDAGLLGQADYYYRIQALNSVSDSDYSTTYHLQTQTAAPSMPSNFSTGTVTYNSAALSWTPGTDPGGSVSTYTVQQSADEGQTWANVSTGITATSYTATGLSPSSIYLLQVLAINSAGVSYAAGPIGAKTPAPPQGVPTLSVSANTTDTSYTEWTSAHLSWTYSGFDQPNFEFQYEDTSIGENFHNGLSLATATGNNYGTASGLNAGDSYVFRMRQDYGDGTVSDWTTAEFGPDVLSLLPKVSVSKILSTDPQQLVVGWRNLPSNGFVQVEFKSDAYPDAGWISFDPDPTQDNHYPVDTGAADVGQPGDQGCLLDPGVRNDAGTYTYRVRGFATLNGSYGKPTLWSDPQTGSLGEGASPSLSIGAVTGNSITINWTAYAAAGKTAVYTLFTERKFAGMDATRPSRDMGLGVGSLSASSESSATQSMSYTLYYLDPGIEYHFVLETFHPDNSIVGFSHITQATSGAVAPDSPGGLTAAWSQSANSGHGAVALHWSDDSNNEAGFTVERSVDNINFTVLHEVPLPVDQNSYVDTTAGPDSAYFYRVKATGDSSGNYDSQYTQTVRVETPGVSITVQSQESDPAANPEIWVDNAAANYSTGAIDAPGANDPNVVPVKVHVPFGADPNGKATLTWSSAIRLYNSSGVLVGNLSGGKLTMQWNVSTGLVDQTFYAQAVVGSTQLGDQSFSLSVDLQLYTDAAVTANPSLHQVNLSPTSAAAATAPYAYITRSVLFGLLPATQQNSVVVGQHVYLGLIYGPATLFPKSPKIVWWVSGSTIEHYVTTNVRTWIVPLPALPQGQQISFYYVDGEHFGEDENATAAIGDAQGHAHTSSFALKVFKPEADFSLNTTNKPVHIIFRDGTPVLQFGNATKGIPGAQTVGTIDVPAFAPGRVALVQLINRDAWEIYADHAKTEVKTTGFELDGWMPYISEDVSPGTNAIWNGYADMPSISLAPDGIQAHYGIVANDYIMYRPNGIDSIYVPLQDAQWWVQMDAACHFYPSWVITDADTFGPKDPPVELYDEYHAGPLPSWAGNGENDPHTFSHI